LAVFQGGDAAFVIDHVLAELVDLPLEIGKAVEREGQHHGYLRAHYPNDCDEQL
jgi:hypothetical protein